MKLQLQTMVQEEVQSMQSAQSEDLKKALKKSIIDDIMEKMRDLIQDEIQKYDDEQIKPREVKEMASTPQKTTQGQGKSGSKH